LLSRVGTHLRSAQREWALLGSNRELRFLADLGRGLLRASSPSNWCGAWLGATYDGTGAVLCAAFVDLGEGVRAVVFSIREGSAENEELLILDRLNSWLTDATHQPRVAQPSTGVLPARRSAQGRIRRAAAFLAGAPKEP